jgi:hypothetical protein
MEKMMKKEIPNTAETYDTMLGVRDTTQAPGSLAGLLGMDDTVKDEKEEWKKLWRGMPTFDNKKVVPLKTLTVNFESEELYNEFIELVGFKTVTAKTKSIWFPEIPREANSLFRFVDAYGDE